MFPAKFRIRKGVPFAAERFSGVQYRCRVCNRMFLEKEELDIRLDPNINAHRISKDHEG